jgi:hypothetical protein
MKEILKQCILVRGALAVRDYIRSIFVQGQVVRPCGDTNEEVQEPAPVKEKAVRKPRAKKVQEVPQAEVATPEKLEKLRKPRAKKTEKDS